MSDQVHSFERGPYDILKYSVDMENGKAVISVNDGDLGRLPVEDIKTIEKLRESLEKIEAEMKEAERRNEEL